MNSTPTSGILLIIAWAVVPCLHHAEGTDRATITERDFDRTVAPLLIRRCLDCHSGPKPKGGLDLSRRRSAWGGGESGDAIVPGKPGESLVWEYVDGGK